MPQNGEVKMAYILETDNPYCTPRKFEILKITKTQIVTKFQRFKRPQKLEDGVKVSRLPRERFELCSYTYKEK